MNIVLMDSATDQVLISNTGERDYLSSRVQGYIFGKDMPKVSILKTHDNYFIQKTYDKRSDSYYLETQSSRLSFSGFIRLPSSWSFQSL